MKPLRSVRFQLATSIIVAGYRFGDGNEALLILIHVTIVTDHMGWTLNDYID